jgi:hypothetical protein
MEKVNMRKSKNRRGYFRIYDEVNLSYKKVDEKWVTDQHPILDNALNDHSFSTDSESVPQDPVSSLPRLERDLPDLEFKEHESHNVNISVSGMAFKCNDALNEGDFLVIKISLASSMAVIVTYSQVVYCKDLQSDDSPNDSPHPYFVGTHFINMNHDDRALLIKHMDKKRVLQNWFNGIILVAVIIALAIPDVVFGLLLEFAHFLLELFLHILHLSFEFIELSLDHLVEHFFETDLHQTQVIVFYVILSFAIYGLYLLWGKAPPFYRRFKQNLFTAYAFKKASWLFFWREQSLVNKIKIVGIAVAAIACYVFFGI